MSRLDTERSPAAIHVGNVVEFNEQFFDGKVSEGHLQVLRRESNNYACLAPFYSSNPLMVVLPIKMDRDWCEFQRNKLHWSQSIAFITPSDIQSSICNAVAINQDFVERLSESEAPLLGWGLSRPFLDLCALVRSCRGQGDMQNKSREAALLQVIRNLESKVVVYDLLSEICLTSDLVELPRQAVATSLPQAADLLVSRSSAFRGVLIKSEFGMGGFGSSFIDIAMVQNRSSALKVVNDLAAEDSIFLTGQLVLQQEIKKADGISDLTFDGEVMPGGEVRVVGSAVMHVEGLKYIGATVGPSVMSELYDGAITDFGIKVGLRLADLGYVGWYDIDFVVSRTGMLYATEINARRTSLTVAHSIRSRYEDLFLGRQYYVRTIDIVTLKSPLTENQLFDHVSSLDEECSDFEVEVVPTLVTASAQEDNSYFGVALVAADRPFGVLPPERTCPQARLDHAESLIRRRS
jgi:hypothetical protein